LTSFTVSIALETGSLRLITRIELLRS